jgi:GWxTD domain-containing protein
MRSLIIMRIKRVKTHFVFFFRVVLVTMIPCFSLHGQVSSGERNENIPVEKQDVQDVYALALEAVENKEYAAAEATLRRVLAEDNLYQEPSGKSAWTTLGLVLEQQEEKFSAVQVLEEGLDSLSSAGLNDWYLHYALARMIAENQFEEHASEITGLMYDLLKNVSPKDQADLWQHLMDEMGFMLGKSERERLEEEISRPEGRPGMVLFVFFRREDPNPITEQNELFAKIFQRAKEARTLYGSVESPRGYDARGEIFIRLGRPWKVHSDHGGLLGEVGYAIYPYEIWFYSQIHPDIYFTFVRERGTGDFELMDGPESVFGTFYRGRQAFMTRSVITKENPGVTSTYLHFLVYEWLAPIHEAFRERVYRMQEQISPAEAADYARRHFIPEDSHHAAMLDTLVPRVAYYAEDVYETLPVDLSMIKFLGEGDQIRAEMYYSIPNEALFFETDSRGEHTRLVGEVGLFDEDFNLVVSDSLDHFWIASSPEEREEGVFISQWNAVLQPDDYNLYFRIENPSSRKMTIIQTDLEIEPFPETGLCLSDLQLARDVQPSEEGGLFNKRGLFIKPLAYNSVPLGQFFFVYFEIYRLTLNSEGQTRYRVDYTLFGSKKKKGFLGLFGGKEERVQAFRESIQKTGDASTYAEYRRFVFDNLKEGDYHLTVTVTDLNTQKEWQKEMPIRLYE